MTWCFLSSFSPPLYFISLFWFSIAHVENHIRFCIIAWLIKSVKSTQEEAGIHLSHSMIVIVQYSEESNESLYGIHFFQVWSLFERFLSYLCLGFTRACHMNLYIYKDLCKCVREKIPHYPHSTKHNIVSNFEKTFNGWSNGMYFLGQTQYQVRDSVLN